MKRDKEVTAKKIKSKIINEVLAETRIKKVYEPYRAIEVMLDNMDKIESKRKLIQAGDRRWNTETSKYVSANYDKLVRLTREVSNRTKFKPKIPAGMILEKSLTKSSGQMLFKNGGGKKKTKALSGKKNKKRVKKGSDNLMTFGIRMPDIKTLEDMF